MFLKKLTFAGFFLFVATCGPYDNNTNNSNVNNGQTLNEGKQKSQNNENNDANNTNSNINNGPNFDKGEQKSQNDGVSCVDEDYLNFVKKEINKIRNEKPTWYYVIDEDSLNVFLDKVSKKKLDQFVILAFKEGCIVGLKKSGCVVTTGNRQDWYLTPNAFSIWNYKEFGSTFKVANEEIGHRQFNKKGILIYAIKGLLQAADPNLTKNQINSNNFDNTNLFLIISLGNKEWLGIDQSAKEYLDKLKTTNKIKDYKILNSKEVPAEQLKQIKAGNKVAILLHTTC